MSRSRPVTARIGAGRPAAESLHVVPEEAVLLDDLPENIEGARAVGMRGVTFHSTEQAIADLAMQLAAPV